MLGVRTRETTLDVGRRYAGIWHKGEGLRVDEIDERHAVAAEAWIAAGDHDPRSALALLALDRPETEATRSVVHVR